MAYMDIEQAFEESLLALDVRGFEGIRESERVLATIWSIEAEVNNGGFDQFFYNSAGDLAFYSATALKIIGALKMAEIAQRALDLFGIDGPPRDREARVARLENISEENEEYLNELDYQFTEYPDNIQDLVLAYVCSNF